MNLILGALTLQHFYYEGYAQTQAILELGSFPYYALLSTLHERDYLLSRRSSFGDAYLARGWAHGSDTFWLGFQASAKREAEALEEGVGLVSRWLRRLSAFKLENYALIEQRSYSTGYRSQDNSGFREELRVWGRPFDAALNAELRPLNQELSAELSPKLSAGPLSFRPTLSGGRKAYETVRGFETKDFYEVSGEVALQLGSLSLKPRASRSWQLYAVNSQNSMGGFSAGAEAELALGWVELGLERGFGAGDYFSTPADFTGNWAEARVVLTRERARFRASIRRDWFDYPEGAVPDARDDRVLTTELLLAPVGFLNFGLRSRFRDLVFVDPRRSQESRSHKRFAAFAVVRGGFWEYRSELSASYSLPWFRLSGTLQRAWDNSVRLRAPGRSLEVRVRFQDYGDYSGGIYYRAKSFAEAWLKPKWRLFHWSETFLWAVGRLYAREDLSERAVGFEGGGESWSARALLVKRTGQELKFDISLSWNY